MQVSVINTSGQAVQQVDLPEYIFGIEPNIGLMHQAYLRQLANARQGTHSTKTRAEVSRTGAKVYRQKGTGRARHGDRGSHLFVGGGVVHGPKPRKYTQSMPKKMRQKAIRSALSALLRDQQLVFVDRLEMAAPKTKLAKQMIETLTGTSSALVLFTQGQDNLKLSVRNLPEAHALLVNYLNIRDLLGYDKVVISLAALEVIKTIWGQEGGHA
ncbi:MAG: 50S ribosomal protein L4 [Anaerolineae bacterium]|jgi:large subunit ribosomal protein L4|nr:50S ribosomal protein L4 [Anaerolineae bacterium]